jgi:hypothetical protein
MFPTSSVRQRAVPERPGYSVAAIVDQSVTPNATFSILMVVRR